jgi:hypothetical protein
MNSLYHSCHSPRQRTLLRTHQRPHLYVGTVNATLIYDDKFVVGPVPVATISNVLDTSPSQNIIPSDDETVTIEGVGFPTPAMLANMNQTYDMAISFSAQNQRESVCNPQSWRKSDEGGGIISVTLFDEGNRIEVSNVDFSGCVGVLNLNMTIEPMSGNTGWGEKIGNSNPNTATITFTNVPVASLVGLEDTVLSQSLPSYENLTTSPTQHESVTIVGSGFTDELSNYLFTLTCHDATLPGECDESSEVVVDTSTQPSEMRDQNTLIITQVNLESCSPGQILCASLNYKLSGFPGVKVRQVS